jgi:lysophospholipase L1-like esterase
MAAKGKLIRILAFGDSLTQGETFKSTHYHPYTHRLRKLLEEHESVKFDIDNAGITGEFVRDQMTTRLPLVLKEKGPYDLIVILGGTNDLIDFTPGGEKDLFDEIVSLHRTAHEHGAKTLLLTIPESDFIYKDMGKNGTSYIKEEGEQGRILINEMLRDFARECDDIVLCDLDEKHRHTTLSEEDKVKYWDDGLHYSPEGYDRMGEIIFEKIKQLYWD